MASANPRTDLEVGALRILGETFLGDRGGAGGVVAIEAQEGELLGEPRIVVAGLPGFLEQLQSVVVASELAQEQRAQQDGLDIARLELPRPIDRGERLAELAHLRQAARHGERRGREVRRELACALGRGERVLRATEP